MKWIDLTPELSKEGRKRMNVGEVLFFGEPKPDGTQLKIMRKHKGKVWAQQVYMYRPGEVFVEDKE